MGSRRPRFLDRVDHRLRVGGFGHDVGLPIDSIVNVGTVSTEFFDERDRLRDLLLGQDRELEGQQFPMSGQTIVAPLGRDDHDDQI